MEVKHRLPGTNPMLIIQARPAVEREVAHLDASVNGTIETQTATMDIADYLKQGGQTAGHRELWRLLRTLFKETGDTDELIN
jgi:hypothetical protein